MSLLLELVQHTGLSAAELRRIIQTAPKRYRAFPISKRNGTERIIAQPSREVKELQRYLLDQKLTGFPVHDSAMAYEAGTSIRKNAYRHKNGNYILKLDFKEFFPSIKPRDLENLIRRSKREEIAVSDIPIYLKILFWGGLDKSTIPQCLSIGSPSSPRISNILMFDIDERICSEVQKFDVMYTRYADDITLSGKGLEVVRAAEDKVVQVVRKSRFPKLEFNRDKRGIYSRAVRRMVTGLVITPVGSISIGRERKREISALLHRSSLNQLVTEERGRLKGLLGFCVACEPEFVGRMREKYGHKTIDEAMKYHVPKKRGR